ncbi:MAG: amino acid/amide transporter substrate-binding protein family [Proteobacteria bacterium]|nr:amino acid/amide transporter substrate-binding protein family [Pseudomonadota bacterium]
MRSLVFLPIRMRIANAGGDCGCGEQVNVKRNVVFKENLVRPSLNRIVPFLFLFLALTSRSGWVVADLGIAHVAPLTGPVAIEAKEYNLGIRLAIAAANASGGVNGQKLSLKTEDDEYTPEKTVAALNRVGASEVLAVLLPIGSPSMSRVLDDRILEQNRLPMVGVIPGAELFRAKTNPYLYHIRAGDHEQYRKLVEHALTLGLKRIAVVYADIPFGRDGLAAVDSFLRERQQPLVLEKSIPVKGSIDFSGVLGGLEKATPDLVIVITPAKLAGEFVQAYRGRGLPGTIAMPSYGNAPSICQIAGDANARGVVLAQVFPNIRNTSLPIVRQYQDALRLHGEKEQKASLFQLEAFIATRVLIEGIRRAGNDVTREKLIAALNAMSKFDLGSFVVSFSGARHTGSNFVEISMIGRDCQLVY